MELIVAICAAVLSGVAAAGVGWQIWRWEQNRPESGLLFGSQDRGRSDVIAGDGDEVTVKVPVRFVSVSHIGDGKSWQVSIKAVAGEILDPSENWRPFMSPGANPMQLIVRADADLVAVIEISRYDSFRASVRRPWSRLSVRRARLDVLTCTMSVRRWWRWKVVARPLVA